MGVAIDAAEQCGAEPCWSPLGNKGWRYHNPTGNAAGITSVKLIGGNAGKPKVQVKGKGAGLPLPAALSGSEFFDQDPSVIVQLNSSSPSACWSSTFVASGTTKNTATQFTAKAP